jgi:hypothetical protein
MVGDTSAPHTSLILVVLALALVSALERRINRRANALLGCNGHQPTFTHNSHGV